MALLGQCRLGVLLLELVLLHLVVVGSGQLHHLGDAHEEIHGKKAVVFRYDHQGIAGPDDARGSQSGASGHGDCVGRTSQVT